MINCHKHLTEYHNEKVTLSQNERSEMRERRDTNRTRIKNWLKSNGELKTAFFESQGSYRDKTMVQYPDMDYDIDDGVYFWEKDLVGRNKTPLSALSVRKMICEALTDSKFNSPPKLHTNCIRVSYTKGYNVDVTVYRVRREKNSSGGESEVAELASSDWKGSDARLASDWFNKVNRERSPDTENGRQFRRIVRLIKKLTSNRKSWRYKVPSGYGLTVLASECYMACIDRDDLSLHATLGTMRHRLSNDLRIASLVKPYDDIAKADDARSKYLLARLNELEDCLRKIEFAISENEALAAWSALFGDRFFRDRRTRETNQDEYSAKSEPSAPVYKGGGRTNA